MKTTTYICDTCKQSKSSNDLVDITVSVKNIHFNNVPTYGNTSVHVDICKDCLQKRGFVIDCKGDKEQLKEAEMKNTNNLQAKIIDILEDIGVSFIE